MRLFRVTLLAAVMISMIGCSKPENRLVGRWVSDRTASIMEFNRDMTGTVQLQLSTSRKSVPFTWTMQGDREFTVKMTLPGTAVVRSGRGSVQGEGALVLEDDPFRKVK